MYKKLKKDLANDRQTFNDMIEMLHQRIDATQREIKTLVEHLDLEWDKGLRLKRKEKKDRAGRVKHEG